MSTTSSHGRTVQLFACTFASVVVAAAGAQQYIPGGSGMTPAERALLWQFGTRRTNDNYFQRQLFAVQAQGRNERMRNQQILRQQYGAQMRAEAERQRIRATMSGAGRGRYTVDPNRSARDPRLSNDEVEDASRSDLWFLWDELGAGFEPADPAAVKKVAPKYTGGVVARAIRVDGPAEAAQWQEGDILVGLNGYQVKSNSDAVFILEQPDLRRDRPTKALVIRGSALFASDIQLPKVASNPATAQVQPLPTPVPAATGQSDVKPTPPPRAAGAEKAGAASPGQSNDRPRRTTSGRELGAPPKVDDTPAPKSRPDSPVTPPAIPPKPQPVAMTEEEQLLWQLVGIRCRPTDGPTADKRFRGGLKLTEIRANSPAAKARWQQNDVLVGFQEYQITETADLLFIVAQPDRKSAINAEFRVLRGRELMVGQIEVPAQ